jgi:uncharacterized protein
MNKYILTVCAIVLLSLTAAEGQTSSSARPAPKADHHQHVFSPPMAEFQKINSITAADVLAMLDAAGIERAVLLSTAFSYGRPGREPADEYAKVKEENDWVGAQAALHPKRLIAFCGFNPRKEYALEELERCSTIPSLKRGLKLHFGNSDVQLENPEHLERMKAIFRAANARKMAILIHMRASFSLNRPYGAEQARLFLEQLMPLATDIPVQIAHLASAGPGYNDPNVDAVMDVFAEAFEKRDPRTRNLWFDVTTIAHPTNPPERTAMVAKRIRQIGVKRILYGSDAPVGSNPNLKPREGWAELFKLGLTEKEIKTIAGNRAPYLG